MEIKAIPTIDDVIVSIIDDGDVSTTIRCRCGAELREFALMASDFDNIRDSEGEIIPRLFTSAAEVFASQFLLEVHGVIA